MQGLPDAFLVEIKHERNLNIQMTTHSQDGSPAHAVNPPSLKVSEERCLHELLIAQCASCKPVIHGPARVYATKAGQVYHCRLDCEALLAGWNYASNRGQEIHEAAPMHVNDAISRGLAPCMGCT